MIGKHVQDRFLTPLVAVFGEPNTPDPERTLHEYGRFLNGYAADELKAAADHLAINHKGPARWPKLAECIDACNDARERLTHKREAAKPNVDQSFYAEANRAEMLMMKTEAGQEAARNGYANGMREFIMKHKRLPHSHETERLLENAAFIDRASTGDVDLGYIHNDLVVLAKSIVNRRHQIADRVMSGEVRPDNPNGSTRPTFSRSSKL